MTTKSQFNRLNPALARRRLQAAASLTSPDPPPSVNRRLNWNFGREGDGAQDFEDIKMSIGSREGSVVGQGQDLNFTNDDGHHGNGGSSRNLPTSRSPLKDEEPLDLSGGGRQYGRAAERQEDRRTPNPQASQDPPTPFSERVPLEFSQNGNSIRSDDDIFDGGDPKVKAANVNDSDIKADDLQGKLARSREDFNRRVFQNDRYTKEETTALMKAIIWKGRLVMKIDDLPIQDIPVHMKIQLYWDNDFRGQGSLLAKICGNLNGIRNRDGGSLKGKWNRVFKDIAQNAILCFEENVNLAEMDDQEIKILVQLAKEYCLMKGIQVSNERPAPASPSSWASPPNGPSANYFLNEDADRDMSVFVAILTRKCNCTLTIP